MTNGIEQMSLEISELNEIQLCKAAKLGDSEAVELLVSHYSRLVKSCVRSYAFGIAESDDLTQEGMLGLWKAVLTFDESKGVPFEAYAHVCIERKIYSAVRAIYAQKHEPLNNAVSLEKPLFDSNAESGTSVDSDPEALVICMEEQAERIAKLKNLLSAFESHVLSLYLDGFSYDEIASKLGKPVKSIDNAIQRIKRKSASVSF